MTWVQAHPPATQIQSQSVAQFQSNNLYIQNTMRQDHFFADSTPGLDGHHQFVQFFQQGADPSTALSPGAVQYAKQAGGAGNTGPFWRSGTGGAYSMMLCLRGGNFVLVNGTNNITNFAGLPAMVGTALAYDVASPGRTLLSPFVWNGVTIVFPGVAGQLASGSQLVRFNDTGSQAQIEATTGLTVNVRYFGELT